MSCRHSNPPGYTFCGICGGALAPQRCRCGFIAGVGDVFCGRCGASLGELAADLRSAVPDADRRFDLEHLARLAAQEKQFMESTHKARVTQDDIRKLLTRRRKRF